jgi:hypothetical protein
VPKVEGEERVCGYTEEAVERLQREERLETALAGGPVVWVYAVSDGTAVKVGKSKRHPKLRMDTGQTFNPNPLRLVGYTAHTTEREAHRKLSRYHLRGEWFKLCSEVLAFVAGFDYVDSQSLAELRAKWNS